MAANLTLAEERGLHGMSLDSRVRQAFYALPPSVLVSGESGSGAEAARAPPVTTDTARRFCSTNETVSSSGTTWVRRDAPPVFA